MAGKTRPMSQIKQLLRLHAQQTGIKTIARQLGISKNTVKAYLHKLAESRQSLDELLKLEDPVLEARFHAGNPAYKDPRHVSGSITFIGVSSIWMYPLLSTSFFKASYSGHSIRQVLLYQPIMVE
ncbi:Helix-turn-helix domain of resolvase [bacterium A37T11]|nr:Helix-turn-helix domain of resolvase [bacterium A37T11]